MLHRDWQSQSLLLSGLDPRNRSPTIVVLLRAHMGGIERGEHNLTIGTVFTISKGHNMSMSELLSGIDKQVASPMRPKKGRQVRPRP